MPVLSPSRFACAYAIDLAIGDPEWFPHPVRLFGWLTARGERFLRPCARTSRVELAAGAVLVAAVCGIAWRLGRWRSPIAEVMLAWTALATRSLLSEAASVLDALDAGDLARARDCLSRIVGRDTAHLDESEIARATIETLAESACDGIVAPMFWLAIAGVPGAMVYKAVNTMDSMIGHPEPPYRYFGRIAARLDDALNFLPARITAAAVTLSAGSDRHRAFHTWRRDGRLHASPNAGQSEAAMAGALGVRLGGRNEYDGQVKETPLLHAEGRAPERNDIRRAMRIVAVVSGVAFGLTLSVLGWRSRGWRTRR